MSLHSREEQIGVAHGSTDVPDYRAMALGGPATLVHFRRFHNLIKCNSSHSPQPLGWGSARCLNTCNHFSGFFV